MESLEPHGCPTEDVIVLEVEVKGAAEPFKVLLEPYALIIPGENYIGINVKKSFKVGAVACPPSMPLLGRAVCGGKGKPSPPGLLSSPASQGWGTRCPQHQGFLATEPCSSWEGPVDARPGLQSHGLPNEGEGLTRLDAGRVGICPGQPEPVMFQMWNNSKSPIRFAWGKICDRHIIEVEPCTGFIGTGRRGWEGSTVPWLDEGDLPLTRDSQ